MSADREWNKGRLLSTSSNYWHGCTLHAGVKLGIFSLLNDRRLTAKDIAKKIAADERATFLLLNALSAMGLIIKENGHFANTPQAAALLVKDSPQYLGYIIMHHHHLMDGWAQLNEVVKIGGPVETRSHGEETERESFLLGMFNLAMGNAATLANIIDLKNRQKLLDLGGGPGTHAIHFCQANPDLQAVIFDRLTTEPFARQTVKKFGLEKRIDFLAGDFNRDPIPGGPYDAAWLSQILHSNSQADCQRLIQKTVASLNPGGLIMIHEFMLEDSLDSPLFPALFSLNMLINNGVGRSYSEGELTAMLEEAGVKKIHRLPFQGPNDSAVLCGTV